MPSLAGPAAYNPHMLILASASPRRRELLAQAGLSFHVVPAHIAEHRRPQEDPTLFATRLAREKAEAVFRDRERDRAQPVDDLTVLGADTIVVVGDEVLGKPASPDDAARMLRSLSGRTHQVITGVALARSTGVTVDSESTAVTFREVTEDEIAAYIATGEPMDKAGAYAIQGQAARWITRIEGCYTNVVGLPLAKVTALLQE